MRIQLKSLSVLHSALTSIVFFWVASSAHAATEWNLTQSPSGVAVSGHTIKGDVASSAPVYNYGSSSGLGVRNSGESNNDGPHASDNYDGIDALVLSFTDKVNLSSFTIGWNGTDNPASETLCTTWSGRYCTKSTTVNYNDSDMSVFAWTGGINGPTNFAPTTTGWTLIGNYFDVGAGSNTESVSTSINSSYWMISALGAGTATCGQQFDRCVDSFKLLTVAGNVVTPPSSGVPEPGSLALLGLGAAGLLAARRKSVARR